jgi:4-alpha-glucanotransferase
MKFKRSSGIILHPTSLPGPYGIGDIGPEAHRWIDFLAETGCSIWQVLPLGPTGYGDSPYQCFSAIAGNPYLISLESLQNEGLLSKDDLLYVPDFPEEHVDYGAVIQWKSQMLAKAYDQFNKLQPKELYADYEKFKTLEAGWLNDFALFMALKDTHGGAPWSTWEPAIRGRNPDALEDARRKYDLSIQSYVFQQFIFSRQWKALHKHAAENGVSIIGDMPIFVAHDSVDVWEHPELFYLDRDGKPTVMSGVPPDYFSPTGQLWGNPLYRWDVHRNSGYQWWLDRFCAVLEMVDIIRLDHFRGFVGYWEVPGNAKTAIKGRWVPAPGLDFLQSVYKRLGDLPIIAEDLGVITADVEELRDHFGLPGMKILQFAFEGTPQDYFLPHNYPRNCVVYTGTHDNDTARGWYERVSEQARDFYRRYLDRSGSDVAWDLIRACWASVAVYAIAPMQDFLNLGNEGRMNYPGKPDGNWQWRMTEGMLSDALVKRIREINYLYDRDKTELS